MEKKDERKFAKERFNDFYVDDIEHSGISKEESNEISLRESGKGMENLAKKISKKKD
jgi:hypothetical protein